jgi:hypothetical protein
MADNDNEVVDMTGILPLRQPGPADKAAPLVRYDAMCRAIDAAYAVDEVKDIRDKALAFEAYAKQAKNTEAERRACEIRLRAERRAGQLLSGMDRAGRGRPEKMSDDTTLSPTPTLSDLGVSRDQSSKWQQLAAVPEAEFESALAVSEKPSTNRIIKKPKRELIDPDALWLWRRLRDFERTAIVAREIDEILARMTESMRHDVVQLADRVGDWLKGHT